MDTFLLMLGSAVAGILVGGFLGYLYGKKAKDLAMGIGHNVETAKKDLSGGGS